MHSFGQLYQLKFIFFVTILFPKVSNCFQGGYGMLLTQYSSKDNFGGLDDLGMSIAIFPQVIREPEAYIAEPR